MTEYEPPVDNWMSDTMRVKTVWLGDNTPLCVIRLMTPDVSEEVWAVAFDHMRRFLKWIKKSNTKYHFLFDLHEADAIPVDRMYQLQMYLRKKRYLLNTHLHSSAIITQSALLEMILNQAFEYFPSNRPVKVIVQAYAKDALRDLATDIPLEAYNIAMIHLLQNKVA
jgi:hypothetical protein